MKKLALTLIALLALAAIAAWIFPAPDRDLPQGGQNPGDIVISATTTVTGTFICLPHKGDGPHTTECAYGLKGNDGANYALDWSDTPVSAFDLPMQRMYTVTGSFVPVEALSSDHWQTYDVKGVIRVSAYEEDASDIPVMPLGTATLELKKPVIFQDTTIRVWAVTEDSRCPSDVQCIQAGRVKIAISLESPSGTSSSTELVIGETATTETLSFRLDNVMPYPVSTSKTSDEDYRFTFTVQAR